MSRLKFSIDAKRMITPARRPPASRSRRRGRRTRLPHPGQTTPIIRTITAMASVARRRKHHCSELHHVNSAHRPAHMRRRPRSVYRQVLTIGSNISTIESAVSSKTVSTRRLPRPPGAGKTAGSPNCSGFHSGRSGDSGGTTTTIARRAPRTRPGPYVVADAPVEGQRATGRSLSSSTPWSTPIVRRHGRRGRSAGSPGRLCEDQS